MSEEERGAGSAGVTHSGWRMLTNTLALAVGSNVIAIGRLVVLAIIADRAGLIVFAQFAVMSELLRIAEGVADFGGSEVFVREVNQNPERRTALLRVLTAMKIVQVPLAYGVLGAALFVMDGSPEFTRAGLVAGVGLAFFGVALVYRVIFRAALRMEREILAEFISVLAMIGLVLALPDSRLSLTALFACYVGARALFGGVVLLLGLGGYRPSLAGVTRADVVRGWRWTAVIGVAGFLVAAYQGIDLLLLSKLAGDGEGSVEVAYFAAAQKLAWPVLMGLAAVGGTLYSVIAAEWPRNPARFRSACQHAMSATLFLGGGAVSGLAGADRFFMDLLGDGLGPGAPVLAPLAVLCVAKAVGMTIGPVLFVVHQQRKVLYTIGAALAAKLVLLSWLASRGRALEVAFGSLGIEVLFVVVPTVWLVHRYTGFLPKPTVALRLGAAVVVAVVAGRWIAGDGTLLAGVLAGVLYAALSWLTGGVRPRDLLNTIRRSQPGTPEGDPGAADPDGLKADGDPSAPREKNGVS